MTTKEVEFNGEILTVLESTELSMFRVLDDRDKAEFKLYIEKNPDYVASAVHHPIVQNEYFKSIAT